MGMERHFLARHLILPSSMKPDLRPVRHNKSGALCLRTGTGTGEPRPTEPGAAPWILAQVGSSSVYRIRPRAHPRSTNGAFMTHWDLGRFRLIAVASGHHALDAPLHGCAHVPQGLLVPCHGRR